MLGASHEREPTPMSQALKFACCVAVSITLAGCGGGGVRKQINPPRASIQQLAVQPDGQWKLTVRLQNFSNVPTAFQSVAATLSVDGQPAGPFTLAPAMTIGPESADVVSATVKPALGAKLAVASALSSGQSVRYVLSGRIVTSTPKGDTAFEFESTLNPAPGLSGVMR
jgi:hypothetical protein